MNAKKSSQPRMSMALKASSVLLGLLAFTSAQALTFCVSDVSTFKGAMNLGQFGSDTPLVIRMVQGIYLMDADSEYQFAAPTTIEGGYTAGCVSRVVNPANTTINVGQNHIFRLTQLSAAPEAQLNLEGLTVGYTNDSISLTAGSRNIFDNDEGSVHLRQMRFTQINSTGFPPVYITATNNTLSLENVLIDHLVSSFDCGLTLVANGGASVVANHVTADLKSGNHFCLAMSLNDAGPSILLSNSIVWNSDGGNSQIIGELSGAVVAIANTLFHSTAITGANVVINNQINAAPGWISPAANNYHLQTSPLSPAINSGTIIVPGGEPSTDIEGNARHIGSAPDRGAYESAVIDFSTLTVTNVQDSGAGSLRQAILDANTSPSIAKTIKFDIRTAGNVPICPAAISLNTVLPAIASTVLIDGYSQPGSIPNTSATAFNANLCVLIKSGGAPLASGLRVLANIGSGASLRLRGVGLGGFSQPLVLLGGEQHLITGNQFGGTVGNVTLTGASLHAISIGVNASDSLIVGGINAADRNAIGGANFNGIDIQSTVQSSTDKCQIVNNLIGLAPNGFGALPNNIGINAGGSGCAIVGNRVAGNAAINVFVPGDNNVVQKNQIGINTQGGGVSNNTAIGLQVNGSGNIIGAGGQGGSITANTIRFNNFAGVIVKGDGANRNSLNANLIYDNGASFNAMDIDLSPTGAATGVVIAALTANDPGDTDSGPNQLQNFPVGTSLVYTNNGTGAAMTNRSATITGSLDSLPGTHRIDAYYSSSANQLGLQGRGYAEVYLGHKNILALGGGVVGFSMPIVIPTQLSSGVVSFTATDSLGNTSEIGTGLWVMVAVVDAVFKNGLE
jgi:trimeric autotransporter adhesin